MNVADAVVLFQQQEAQKCAVHFSAERRYKATSAFLFLLFYVIVTDIPDIRCSHQSGVRMGRSITFWVLALLLTLGSAYWQRKSGPTYPVDGSVEIGGTSIQYSLTRSHGGNGDQPLVIIAPDAEIQARLSFRRFNTDDTWSLVPFQREGDRLRAALPHQPPAGKLEYTVELLHGAERVTLSAAGRAVVTRFKGDVPAGVLIPHVIFMFIAMLLSTRAGFEAILSDGDTRPYAVWTISMLFIGGLVLGPLVQKYAFGEYWTGIPYGTDLTDNKTLIAFVFWLIAVVAVWNRSLHHSHPGRRWFVLAASLVMLVVFVIPHSMWGSELKYDKAKKAPQLPVSSITLPIRTQPCDGSIPWHVEA
jgi:hypothetical protein